MTISIHGLRSDRIRALAVDTFGTEEKAFKWLNTPNHLFENRKPVDLLNTNSGTESVETVLGRIAYGVYS